jgi:predicted transcriptional regulator
MNVYCGKRKGVAMTLSEAVGKRVENLLAERNMTQYQLYKNGAIPRSTISVTVDGKYKTVKLDTIYQIVATLGITLKEFFDDPLFDEIED